MSRRLLVVTWIYILLLAICLGHLAWRDDLSLGRRPWTNFRKTVTELAYPSFLDVWLGNSDFTYSDSEGHVLRREDQKAVEKTYLSGVARAAWTSFEIATLGSALAALLALPLGLISARNLKSPLLISALGHGVLNVSRSIHTLVFGLFLVGIVGLGPTAGILAIALHSLGTYGKLYAEAIENLDLESVEAVRAVGASRLQVFFNAIWPALLPTLISTHFYIWEYNMRDSTVLGLVGAGGLGLLISEATGLFQWGRLSTILLVIVILVTLFNRLSLWVRREVQ